MTNEQAEHLIANITKRHKLFILRGFQCYATGAFITFEPIERDPRTVGGWFDDEGVNTIKIGTQGTGDNEVMYVEVLQS